MNFLQDWKFWMFCLMLVNSGLSIFALVIIKFNDFKHVKENQKTILKKLDNQSERISFIEGMLSIKKQDEQIYKKT